jgi:hypothetical protein
MIVKIVTEREILEEDLDNYIYQLKKGGVNLDSTRFKEGVRVLIKDDFGYTKATTTYEIVR